MTSSPLNSTNYKLPLAAYAAVWGTGFLSQTTSPHLIAALVASRNLDEVQAGTVQTAELAMIAVTALLLAPWAGRLPKRWMAISGAVIAAVAHAMSALSVGYTELIALRMVAGSGAALALVAGNTAIAASTEPERVYGRMLMILGMASLIVLVVMGYCSERWGARGTYGFQAVWILMLLPLLWRLPEREQKVDGTARGYVGLPLISGLLVILTMGLFASGDIAIWSFSGQIAVSLGMDSTQAGWVFGGGSLLAIFGGAAAAMLGDRWGYAMPVALGFLLVAISAIVITSASAPLSFVVSTIAYQGVYMFLLSYIYGAAGKLDPDGRVMVAAAAFALFGASAGPYLAGTLAAWSGYPAIGHYFVVGVTMAMAFMLMAVRCSSNRIR
jgi:MFS family permease